MLFCFFNKNKTSKFNFYDLVYDVNYYNEYDQINLKDENVYSWIVKSMGLEEKKRKKLEQIFSSYNILNGGIPQVLGSSIKQENADEDEIDYGIIDGDVYMFSLKINNNPYMLSFHIKNGQGAFFLSRIGRIKNNTAFVLHEKVDRGDGMIINQSEGIRYFIYPGLDKELAQFLVENYDTIKALEGRSNKTIRKYPLPIEWLRLIYDRVIGDLYYYEILPFRR